MFIQKTVDFSIPSHSIACFCSCFLFSRLFPRLPPWHATGQPPPTSGPLGGRSGWSGPTVGSVLAKSLRHWLASLLGLLRHAKTLFCSFSCSPNDKWVDPFWFLFFFYSQLLLFSDLMWSSQCGDDVKNECDPVILHHDCFPICFSSLWLMHSWQANQPRFWHRWAIWAFCWFKAFRTGFAEGWC